MAQSGIISFVQTNPQTQFSGACVQNAGLTEDIALPMEIAAGKIGRSRVRSITIYSVQNLSWELQFYGNGVPGGFAQGGGAGTTQAESFLGRWTFQISDGVQGPTPTGPNAPSGNAVGGNWLYYIDGLDIAYEDRSLTPVAVVPGPTGQIGGGGVGQGLLHLALVNRSATAKIVAGPGAIVIRIGVEPELGWA